jgi:chemotaxis protein methyltransferase CheR
VTLATDLDRMVQDLADAHGLVWTPSRRGNSGSVVRRAMDRTGAPDLSSFQRMLADTEGARHALLDELTVGESYFFREGAQFEFIRRTVLPDLLARRPGSPIRIWSAGCAVGEEPYTLAMVMRAQGLTGRVTIVGTDVSRRRLAAARRGRYSRWALRTTPPEMIAAYFRPEGNGYVLAPEIREAVEFRVLNLAQDTWPSAASGIQDFDLVLCRNVLIYFSDAMVRSVVTRMVAALAPGGWLCLGASDPALFDVGPCETFTTGAGLAHRCGESLPALEVPPLKAAEALLLAPAAEDAPAEIAAFIPGEAVLLAPTGRPVATPAPITDPGADATPSRAAVVLAEIRALSDAGHLEEAHRLVSAVVADDPMDPELHHALALLLQAAGRKEEAVDAVRRAVCLDPAFAAGHLLLGLFVAGAGDGKAARRSLARAARLLSAMPPDTRPAGGGGETASALLVRARAHLQSRARGDR